MIRCGAEEPGRFLEHRLPAGDRSVDNRDVRVVPIANPHGLLVLEIDAVERLDERRDEVPSRLLAVGDDVDAGALLVREHEPHRVALRFGEGVALEPPRRPEHTGIGQPVRLGQAAGDGRGQDLAHGAGVRWEARPIIAAPFATGQAA